MRTTLTRGSRKDRWTLISGPSGLLFGFWGGGSGFRLRRWAGAAAVVSGHKIPKLKVAASMARPVRFGCCEARSQLSFYHIITFKLVRSGEIKPPDCLCAISGSAPSQRGAFWWKFRLILGPLNRPLEHHWHSWNRKICDFKKLDFFMIYTCDEI